MIRCINSIIKVEDADVGAVSAEDAVEAGMEDVGQTDNHAAGSIAIPMGTVPTMGATVVLQVQPTQMKQRSRT